MSAGSKPARILTACLFKDQMHGFQFRGEMNTFLGTKGKDYHITDAIYRNSGCFWNHEVTDTNGIGCSPAAEINIPAPQSGIYFKFRFQPHEKVRQEIINGLQQNTTGRGKCGFYRCMRGWKKSSRWNLMITTGRKLFAMRPAHKSIRYFLLWLIWQWPADSGSEALNSKKVNQ